MVFAFELEPGFGTVHDKNSKNKGGKTRKGSVEN